MYLEWMGKNRAFVEKFIRYANTYAAVYKKEALYGTDIPISFEQVQVLEYLLENEQLNQNMSMIASRLGITPSNFTRIVNKLSGKNLLEKYLCRRQSQEHSDPCYGFWKRAVQLIF